MTKWIFDTKKCIYTTYVKEEDVNVIGMPKYPDTFELDVLPKEITCTKPGCKHKVAKCKKSTFDRIEEEYNKLNS